jgi:hypothetical protein
MSITAATGVLTGWFQGWGGRAYTLVLLRLMKYQIATAAIITSRIIHQ